MDRKTKSFLDIPDADRRDFIEENIKWFRDHGFVETASAIEEIFKEIKNEQR